MKRFRLKLEEILDKHSRGAENFNEEKKELQDLTQLIKKKSSKLNNSLNKL